MKKIILVLLLIFNISLLYSQEQKQVKVVTTIKGADPKDNRPGEKKAENTTSTDEEKPVIIQTLEYKSDEFIQEEKNTDAVNIQPVSTLKISDKEDEVKSLDDQINNLNSLIKAIESKVASVQNNPEEDKRARENGWYAQMKKSHEDAVAKRDILINSKK